MQTEFERLQAQLQLNQAELERSQATIAVIESRFWTEESGSD